MKVTDTPIWVHERVSVVEFDDLSTLAGLVAYPYRRIWLQPVTATGASNSERGRRGRSWFSVKTKRLSFPTSPSLCLVFRFMFLDFAATTYFTWKVHGGGKRLHHQFRALYDFYGKRVDYGEGEFPSYWPTDMAQVSPPPPRACIVKNGSGC